MKAVSRFGIGRLCACAAAIGLASLTTSALAWNWTSSERYGKWTDAAGWQLENCVWGATNFQQTIYADSHSKMQVDSNLKADQYIGSYPRASKNIGTPVNDVANAAKPLMTDFDVTTDRSGVFDHAFDLWANGETYEVMIWNDWNVLNPIADAYDGNGAIPRWRDVTINGQTYNVYTGKGGSGPNCISFLPTTHPIAKATLNLSAFLKWISGQTMNGQAYWSNPTLTSVQLGWEICDTLGRMMTYKVNNFEVYYGDPVSPPPTYPLLLNVGGAASGSYVADGWVTGGATGTVVGPVDTSLLPAPVPPQAVFSDERYGEMTYTLTQLAANQTCLVDLLFAEGTFSAAGQRRFNAAINATAVLTNFDIFAAAGGKNKAIMKTFEVKADANGQLVIAFTKGAADSPKVDAIRVTPKVDPFKIPTYISTGGPAIGEYIADAYFTGGTVAVTTAAINTSLLTATVPQSVLQHERWGPMTYTFSGVTAGNYTVSLFMVETYATAAGGRQFNVKINGTAVMTNFDIFAAAGAMNKAVQKDFPVTVGADGKVLIEFTAGAANNPKIDGLAITSSGPVNTPPTIAPIPMPGQVIAINTSTTAIPFTVADTETPVANLTLVGSSNAPALIPTANIVFGGSGANRTVTVTPVAGQSGTATVSVQVNDGGGLSASTSFTVEVKAPEPVVMLDRNGDGISDVWAALYPTAGGPAADPDGDGVNNLDEAQAGTDPLSAASRFFATTTRDASGNIIVRWPSVAGKRYYIETSTDLITWAPLATEYAGTGTELAAIVRPAGTVSATRAFWHVVVFDAASPGSVLNDWEKTHPEVVATIAANPGANGSITPAGTSYVAKGGSLAFAITPNMGYVVEAVLVDGTTVGAVRTYTYNNISAGAHSIIPTFKVDGTFSVSPTVVDLGSTATLTVTAVGAWTAGSDQSWLTVAPLLGNGNGTITISATANTGTIARSAVVTVRGPAGSPLVATVSVTQAPDVNIALGKTATASSTEGTFVAANAVDASATTRWSSLPTDSQWIKVDLGGVFSINRVVLKWEGAFGKAYKIQVSTDDSVWSDIYSTTTGAGGVETLNVTGVGRYIRMNGTVRGTAWGYSLYDFQVIGRRAGHYLSATPGTLTMPASGAGSSVAVSTDQSWTATSSQAWLKVAPASGTGDGTITLSSTALTTGTRTATVTIAVPTDTSLTQTVTVTQTDTATRVESYITKMTTAEKADQLFGLRGQYFGQPENPRLGIPGFQQADGPHGTNWTPATVFPVGIAAAATWDPEYMQIVGRAMAKEFRAHGRNQMLGPAVDINRDPRYGRSPESGGEDPYLSGKVNAGIVKGAQAYGMVATAKHFVKTNKESNKDNENDTMNDRTLMDLYVKPFQIIIEDSNVFSIMNAYGKVNGPTCSESSALQTEILRNRLGFKYFVVSDWNEVQNTNASIAAGNDICMGSDHYMNELLNNVNNGQIPMATLDQAVRRALRAKVDSGVIDGMPPGNGSDLNSAENRTVALIEAHKGIVLLKNVGGILPLKSNADSIALIGPNVKSMALDGRGSSWIDPTDPVTPYQGFVNKTTGVTLNYEKGCDVNSTDTSGFAAALTAARNSKTVVFIGGLDKFQEGENGDGILDRTTDSVTNQKSFQLPGRQQELINQLAAVNPNIVVVIESGGTCGVNRCVSNIKGLLYAYYPGIRGGDAIADIVFGNVNPSGKMPVTMAKTDSQLPDWNKTDYSGDEVAGFGYKKFDKEGLTPEFAFGFGLSYTSFAYSNIRVTASAPGSGNITVTADVTNTGLVAGDEVAQLYLSHASASVPMPVKQLEGFKRVTLASGQTKTVTFVLTPNELSYWSLALSHFFVEKGSYTVKVGGSSDNLPLSATFTITSDYSIPYGGL